MKKLLLATHNEGKIKEIKDFLSDLPLEITSFLELGLSEIEEKGETFEANALLKARYGAEKTGLLTLADDSGLEVEFLDNAPGVFSARFAGLPKNDEANIHKLLELLKGVPFAKRKARFRCIIALIDGRWEKITEGVVEGYILEEPKGKGGFGYDPVFFLPQYGKTMAELSLAEKNKISHRAKALEKAKKILLAREEEGLAHSNSS